MSSRYPIGVWARQRKEKRQVLVEANKSIQELEEKFTELNTKVSYVINTLNDFWFCDYLLILRFFLSKEYF